MTDAAEAEIEAGPWDKFRRLLTSLGGYFDVDAGALLLVALGGGLGGFLWPYVDLFSRAHDAEAFENFPWYLRIVIGFAAGGAGTFVLASTDTSHRNHLIFFSLICGLTAPTLLPMARDRLSQQVIDETSRANDVSDLTAIAETANVDNVSPEAKVWFEERSKTILLNEALDAVAKPVDASQRIETIQNFGLAASGNGFVKPAEDAARALEAISSRPAEQSRGDGNDAQVQKSAQEAAKEVREKIETMRQPAAASEMMSR